MSSAPELVALARSRLGGIGYHPSLLPDHRGPSSINWPIAQGKTQTGLTIFWPDEGLDEGPVLLQKSVEIGADETLGDVYFKKLFPLGVDAMIVKLGAMTISADQQADDDPDRDRIQDEHGLVGAAGQSAAVSARIVRI